MPLEQMKLHSLPWGLACCFLSVLLTLQLPIPEQENHIQMTKSLYFPSAKKWKKKEAKTITLIENQNWSRPKHLPEIPPQTEQVYIHHISSNMAWEHAL